MKTSQYLILLLLGTVLGFGAWLAVLALIDPDLGWPALGMFILTIGLWLFGLTASFSTLWRLRQHGEEAAQHVVPMSMRQASVITGVFLAGLVFLYLGKLSLPVLVLLALTAGFGEWVFAKRALAKAARRG